MIDVVMPQMGESIVEGTLTKWLKKPGENVERDEPLFEISTDKVDTEIPVARRRHAGRDSGRGREDRRHQHDRRTHQRWAARCRRVRSEAALPPPRRAPRARRRRSSADSRPRRADSTPAPPARCRPASEAAAPAETEDGPHSARPLVRKMARENNIDLKLVKGTGAGGRITKQDLEAYIAQAAPAHAAAPAAAASGPHLPPSLPLPPPLRPPLPAPSRPGRASSP